MMIVIIIMITQMIMKHSPRIWIPRPARETSVGRAGSRPRPVGFRV